MISGVTTAFIRNNNEFGPMSLWMLWWNAIWRLRPAFSRLRTFLWFATAVAERIAVAMLGVAGEIALGDDMLEQEAPSPGAKESFVIHGTAPWHNVQSAGSLGAAVPASA